MIKTRQRKLIQLIADTGNISMACQLTGVARDTYYKWLKDKEFCNELEKHKNIACENVVTNLEAIYGNAINAYNQLVNTNDEALKFKVAAAIISEIPKIIDFKEDRNILERCRRDNIRQGKRAG